MGKNMKEGNRNIGKNFVMKVSVKRRGAASDWGCDLQYQHAAILYGSGQHSAGRCGQHRADGPVSHSGSAGGALTRY